MIEGQVTCSCGEGRVLVSNGRTCVPGIALDVEVHQDSNEQLKGKKKWFKFREIWFCKTQVLMVKCLKIGYIVKGTNSFYLLLKFA